MDGVKDSNATGDVSEAEDKHAQAQASATGGSDDGVISVPVSAEDAAELLYADVGKKERQLQAARYVAHKLFVHKYATAVKDGSADLATAEASYDEAMRNYDGIIAQAIDGTSAMANANDVAKGATAIEELLKAH